LNDADAAAIAEVNFGAGQVECGKVLLLTLGTGIGSALIVNRALIGATELGHLLFPSESIAERYCSGKLVKGASALSWLEYAERLNGYLQHLELLFSPDLFILGGGICKQHEHLQHLLQTQRTPIRFAALGNNAGIVGAALIAHQTFYLPAQKQLALAASPQPSTTST
jgi:polyphosphate glucokinase